MGAEMSGSDWTVTPNLGLYKPTVDADFDIWGDHWNSNADTLDTYFGPGAPHGPYVPIAGNVTMTGPLTLSGNAPAGSPLQAVPLQQVNLIVGNYLPLTGGQLSGNLIGTSIGLNAYVPPANMMPGIATPNWSLGPSPQPGTLQLAGNAWQSNTSVWSFLNTGPAAVLSVNSGGAGGFVFNTAPSGTAGTTPAWNGVVSIGPTGNIGVGSYVLPGDAVPGSILGQRQMSANLGNIDVCFNAYWNGTAWTRAAAAATATFQVWPGEFRWYTAPSAAVTVAPAWTQVMDLTSAALTVNVPETNNAGRVVITATGNNPSVCVWDKTYGAAGMFLGGGALELFFGQMDASGGYYNNNWYGYFDNSGNLYTRGNINCGGGTMTGSITGNCNAASYAYNWYNGSSWANFRWAGQGGMPSYVLGSNDGVNILVWQPQNLTYVSGGFTATGNIVSKGNTNACNLCMWAQDQGAAKIWFMGGSNIIYLGSADGGGNYAGTTYCHIDNAGSGTFPGALTCGSYVYPYGIVTGVQGTGQGFGFRDDGYTMIYWVNTRGEVSLTPYCDERIKEAIAPSQVDCLELVRRLPLHEFRYKKFHVETGGYSANPDGPIVPIGFIAQRVGEVFPDGEIGPSVARSQKVRHPVTHNINLNTIVAALTGAVQQLAARVQQLETMH
jgi:hypothetical protein